MVLSPSGFEFSQRWGCSPVPHELKQTFSMKGNAYQQFYITEVKLLPPLTQSPCSPQLTLIFPPSIPAQSPFPIQGSLEKWPVVMVGMG